MDTIPPGSSSSVINMRSDTQTLPTEEMLEAIRKASLGDESYYEDPSVLELEKLVCKLFNKEAALLTISGTMANLVSLMTHACAGSGVVLDPQSHIAYYELEGLEKIAQLRSLMLEPDSAGFIPEELSQLIKNAQGTDNPARLLCIENTHNRRGGKIMPLKRQRELTAIAKSYGLNIHLDAARIFNASVASGIPVSEYAKDVDSLMFCLSKGLSCPLGSVLLGSADFIAKAREIRKMLGGGMRQAGVIAAAGIVALESMIDKLAIDHKNAKILAEGLNKIPGFKLNPESVETNIIYVNHSAISNDTQTVLKRLHKSGILASGDPPDRIRFVVNRHHNSSIIAEALSRITEAFKCEI